MDNPYILTDDEERRARRAEHVQKMKREKARQEQFRKMMRAGLPIVGVAIAAVLLVFIGIKVFHMITDSKDVQANDIEADTLADENDGIDQAAIGQESAQQTEATQSEEALATDEKIAETRVPYAASVSESTVPIDADIVSTQAILVDLQTDTILAERDCKTIISPASMTKVLTLLVAAEHITNLDDTFTMTIDITDFCYQNDCSCVGFMDGEKVTVRDLLYGTILPSGGDAAMGLAAYVAGSQEAFVDMMNEKLNELGLSETAHFTNCIGTYDENHHCTIYDMAMIMEVALDNELCKEVLSAHTYTTSLTTEHPEGIIISNWFLRRIEDKDAGGEVVCGKTGYVVESGNCAVSYASGTDGKEYVLATANSSSSWRCIYDHVDIYHAFLSDENIPSKETNSGDSSLSE